jgi:hypothetical protein
MSESDFDAIVAQRGHEPATVKLLATFFKGVERMSASWKAAWRAKQAKDEERNARIHALERRVDGLEAKQRGGDAA